MGDDRAFGAKMARIEVLTDHLDQSPNLEEKALARELVGALLDLHGEGLARILEIVKQHENKELVAILARDGQVASLLLLHGLHPDDLSTRVQVAIDDARSRLLSKTDSKLDLVSLVGETATLRLSNSSNSTGCPSTAGNMRRSVQEILLSAVPDLESVAFEETTAPTHGSMFLPVITL